jgi:DNA segregation ATPase FtsK/SpoIIIE, S-DNA-T family
MAKRGRRRKFKLKFNIRPETIRSILALILLLAAALSFISFFFPDYSVNSLIQRVLRGTFGWASFVVPLLLAISGLLFVQKLKLKIKEVRITVGLLALLISLSGLLGVLFSSKSAGGRFGGKVAAVLSNMLSKWGAGFIFIFGTIISFIVILDVSLDQIIEFLGKYVDLSFLSKITKRGSKDANSDDMDIEISPGISSVDSDEDSKKSGKKVAKSKEPEEIEEPSFEVLPTMAEPQATLPKRAEDTMDATVSPRLPYADKIWEPPPLSLLADPDGNTADVGDVEARAKVIQDTLRSFGIGVQVADVKAGPTITQYQLKTRSGTKVSKIASLHNDLAMALASKTGTVRIEAPIPGKALIGIEVPNNTREYVNFKSLLTSDTMKAHKSKLAITLGVNVGGQVHVYDIAKMPHLLIAGSTGSGKSVFIHNILFSILYRASPQEVKIILVDPKRVELSHYRSIPHLLTPVVTDMDKAPSVFRWAVAEMEKRYKLLEQAKARNIDAYNEKSGFQAMPYIVIVVDELAEIMARDPAGVEKSIIRIAQLARAVGIHLVLAVQRPSADIITGLIKANIPARVAFSVSSQVNSRVIIDQPGAEKLLAKGDLLFVPPDAPKPVRLQGAWVSDPEIERVTKYLRDQGMEADFKDEILAMPEDSTGRKGRSSGGSSEWGDDVDKLFDDAVELVLSAQKASASLLQRKLSIGYARAARIIDEMEERNIIGPSQGGSRAREVLVSGNPKGASVEAPISGLDVSSTEDVSAEPLYPQGQSTGSVKGVGGSAGSVEDIIAPDDPLSSNTENH